MITEFKSYVKLPQNLWNSIFLPDSYYKNQCQETIYMHFNKQKDK